MYTISIVIPSHNRSERLKRTITSIAKSKYDLSVVELIVVADGCRDDTAAMLAAQQVPFTLRWIELPGVGAAAARNAGAAAAVGKLLLFLDDDIDVTPEWLAAHVAAHASGEDRLVIGKLPLGDTGRDDLFYRTLRLWWSDLFERLSDPAERLDHTVVITGNLSMRTDLFAKIGGFDETLRIPREDYEFGLRALKLGCQLTYAPAALAHHFDLTTLNGAIQRKFKEGAADVTLGMRHPDAIDSLPIYIYALHSRLPSRMLQVIARFLPKLGDNIVTCIEKLLPVIAYFQLVPLWQHLLSGLFAYWYMRGVRTQLTTREELDAFVRLADTRLADDETRLDLNDSLTALQAQVAATRPQAVALYDENLLLGREAPLPYAEPLRPAHLGSVLQRHVTPQYLFDMLFVTTASGLKRREDMVKNE